MVVHESPKNFKNIYKVDVNNIVASANLVITSKQNILGLVTEASKESRDYFTNFSLATLLPPDMMNSPTRPQYFVGRVSKSFNLNEIMQKAGANVVTNKSAILDLITPKGDKYRVQDDQRKPLNLEANNVCSAQGMGRDDQW